MNYKYSKEALVVGGHIGLGYCSVVELSREEREAVASAFHDSCYLDDVKVEFYNQVILKNAEGNPFYSAVYGRPEVFDDTCVELMDHSYAVSYSLPGCLPMSKCGFLLNRLKSPRRSKSRLI